MGMVVPQNVQSASTSVPFNPQLLLRVNQEAVLFRLPSGVIQWQQFLRTCGIMAQILQRHHLRNFLGCAVCEPQEHAAAFVRVCLGPMGTNAFKLFSIQLYSHSITVS